MRRTDRLHWGQCLDLLALECQGQHSQSGRDGANTDAPDHRGELAITLPDTVGDAELEQMSALDRLKPVYIQVQGRQITGEGLKWLKRFPYIFGLTLHGTKVGDDDLTQLAAFPKLDTLNLDASPISDRGLLLLKDLRSLQSVSVRSTLVTAQGVEKLQKARPDLVVFSKFMPDRGLD